jgi:hypothetical protein
MFVMKAAYLIEVYTYSVLGRGYTEARAGTTQQTNICLGIHRQTRVAKFNPTCLSRLVTTVGLFALSFHFSTTLWTIFLCIKYTISRY